ncbi:MAG: hypothetical protein M3275_15915 [Thermoproteota archaeon]|nr:hypothetical protein [Thermoproteota archaeon]
MTSVAREAKDYLNIDYLDGYNGRCSVYLTQQEGLSFRMVAAAAAP